MRTTMRWAAIVPLLLWAAMADAQTSVGIPGSYQSTVGCTGNWQPDCGVTQLTYDAGDDVWQGTFNLVAGNWEYKAALDGSWNVNYGLHAQPNGPNIPLNLAAARPVKFYYSPATHWVTDNVNSVIATVPGNFQAALGCPGDWQPDCLRSWLQDPDGDGLYSFTAPLPAGTYEAKVAIDESWNVNYGAGGVQNGANISFTVPTAGTEVLFEWDSVSHVLSILVGGRRGNLSLAQAHWVAPGLIAWPTGEDLSSETLTLHGHPTGGLVLDPTGVLGGVDVPLTYDPAGLPPEVLQKFPHLAGAKALRLPASALPQVPTLLTGQLAVSAVKAGNLRDATGLQLPGVLDALYAPAAAAQRLGATFQGRTPTLRVWAPTARNVRVLVFDGPSGGTAAAFPMTRDASGTWSVKGSKGWYGKYYLYEVEVYAPSVNAVVVNQVTDPYSVALSRNSSRSQIVSLADPALAPPGWNELHKPRLDAFEDIVVYELHVRDFSQNDPAVPAWARGRYGAFALEGTPGAEHLRRLAGAGVTHVHLLPSFDFATVNEDPSTWQSPPFSQLAALPPASTAQRQLTSATAGVDGFNWGYDPWHYTVPEGSYAREPDGGARVREFREMVQSLNRKGLRVVMDVVYNHTTASGQDGRSVLDRIVPGYYHRLDANGAVETSTCCQNTATEHDMMRKLMVDSVVTWARLHKVDGFRFDLMGHHMKADMLAVRAALDALTPERDGVDGKKIYVYGEGWNFGEVANDARGVNATQLNMAGTRIGTFNDRLRDGVRGGGPFSPRPDQGFATGLFTTPNAFSTLSDADAKDRLLRYADWVKVGMAGNLADVALVDRTGAAVIGAQVDYNGSPAGYAREPADTINYISAHDNDDWFDALDVKAPQSLPMAERVRLFTLGQGVVALSQGIPFFHAGDEILRSKSGDGNSYDSGDWFNRIDWTLTTNGWGSGLPPGGPDDVLAPLLADPALAPQPAHIRAALRGFEELLRIRSSVPLFRLRTGAEIRAATRFYNQGPDQVPGLIVMRLVRPAGSGREGPREVVVVVNARPDTVTFQHADFAGGKYQLHPIQRASFDPLVRTARAGSDGSFTVPRRTLAVFVRW